MRKYDLKEVYIVFSYSGTMFSKFLRLVTRSKYVHTSLAFDENLTEVYSFGRKDPYKMLPAGLIREDLKKVTSIFKMMDCVIYKIEIKRKSYMKLKKILDDFLIEIDKYQYDILGLPFIFMGRKYRRRYHRVCSQFVGYLLQESNIYDFKIDYSLLTPDHIMNIENKQLIYQGNLLDYIKKKSSL